MLKSRRSKTARRKKIKTMSDMYNKISNDIKDAMKAHDNVKRDCLRTVMSDIKNLTVNAGKEITDDACLKVL